MHRMSIFLEDTDLCACKKIRQIRLLKGLHRPLHLPKFRFFTGSSSCKRPDLSKRTHTNMELTRCDSPVADISQAAGSTG